MDGFRALLHCESGHVRLISRRNNTYKLFDPLCRSIEAVLTRDVVLDGEIVCLDAEGRPQFYDLLRKRGTPVFYAFDVLSLDGWDLRLVACLRRKQALRRLIPENCGAMLYAQHVIGTGVEFFRLACERDLEGILAKH